MTPPIITPLQQPIAIRPEYIAQRNAVLHFRHHIWSGGFSVTDRTGRTPLRLFRTRCKFWGGQQIFREPLRGPALLELRNKTWTWSSYILLPKLGHRTAVVQLYRTFTWSRRQKMDVDMLNLAPIVGDAEINRLRLEGQSRWNTRLNVYLGDSDTVVMTAKRDLYRLRTEWWVAVAEGFDLSLVSKQAPLSNKYLASSDITFTGHCVSCTHPCFGRSCCSLIRERRG